MGASASAATAPAFVMTPEVEKSYRDVLGDENFKALTVEQKAALLDKFRGECFKNEAKELTKENATMPKGETEKHEKEITQVALSAEKIEEGLRTVFEKFALFGAGGGKIADAVSGVEIDGSKFSKLCVETKLVDKKLKKTDVDMVFAKVKAKGARKINFIGFQAALREIADRKGVSHDTIVQTILRSSGPDIHGTIAGPARFYDDKSTWGQGVHAHGGPTTLDNRITLSNLADRSEADVRGCKLLSSAA